MKNNTKIYTIYVLLILYLIGVFSGLFRYLGKYFLSFDNETRDFLFSLHTPFWDVFLNIITLFGEVKGFALFGIVALGIFLFYRKKDFLLPFIVTIIGTEIFVLIGKIFTDRIRPSGEEFSFPSNHAAIALALFGFVIYTLTNFFHDRRKSETIYNYSISLFIIICLLLIILIGFSRIYLGAHFLSDVIMGYIVAGLWFILAKNMYIK
ncbi:MAG: phosphatase PAP2 family protein [Patescibacteria group bacterium]